MNMFKYFNKLVEEKLSLPKKSVNDIVHEDDWSFIIKLSSILEKALNYLITKNIKQEPIKNLVYDLGLEKKVELAFNLKIINSKAKANFNFIRNIRNEAAHGIEFKFDTYFNKVSKLNAYKSQFKDVWNEQIISKTGQKITNVELTEHNQKVTLFFAVVGHLSDAELDSELAALKKNTDFLNLLLKS